MKKLLVSLMIILSTSAMAEGFQAGVILGAPTGISLKQELGNNRAIDGVIAYSLDKDMGFDIHADYLFENAKRFTPQGVHPLDLYYGLGLRVVNYDRGEHNDKLGFGPRLPLGVTMDFTNPSIQLFAEMALILDVVPATDVFLDAGIGVRLKF